MGNLYSLLLKKTASLKINVDGSRKSEKEISCDKNCITPGNNRSCYGDICTFTLKEGLFIITMKENACICTWINKYKCSSHIQWDTTKI